MHEIKINIVNKIASYDGEEKIVCNNSDYVARFVFDDEWSEYLVKTAKFILPEGDVISVVFEGDTCPIPVLQKVSLVKIGVEAGNIRTSTSAIVTCRKSAACEAGEEISPPSPDVYTQIVGLCESAVETAKSVEERANNGEFDGEKGDKGEKGDRGDKGDTPQKGVDYFTNEEKSEFVKEVETACLGDIGTALDELHTYAQNLIGGNE